MKLKIVGSLFVLSLVVAAGCASAPEEEETEVAALTAQCSAEARADFDKGVKEAEKRVAMLGEGKRCKQGYPSVISMAHHLSKATKACPALKKEVAANSLIREELRDSLELPFLDGRYERGENDTLPYARIRLDLERGDIAFTLHDGSSKSLRFEKDGKLVLTRFDIDASFQPIKHVTEGQYQWMDDGRVITKINGREDTWEWEGHTFSQHRLRRTNATVNDPLWVPGQGTTTHERECGGLIFG
jgi:hypothetical protein